MANDRLSQLPEKPRPVECLVVETHRHQPAEELDAVKEIAIERRPRMLGRNLQTFTDGNAADALVGTPGNVHKAVGTIARTTEQASGPVIFETAAENPASGGKQRHGHRLSDKGFERLALEIEGHFPGIIDLSRG